MATFEEQCLTASFKNDSPCYRSLRRHARLQLFEPVLDEIQLRERLRLGPNHEEPPSAATS
jgi:hypothetical protein